VTEQARVVLHKPSALSVAGNCGDSGITTLPRAGRGSQRARRSALWCFLELILMSVQDDTNYGMLSVVTDDWRNAWQDLDR
jgi:hypothetical protein